MRRRHTDTTAAWWRAEVEQVSEDANDYAAALQQQARDDDAPAPVVVRLAAHWGARYVEVAA